MHPLPGIGESVCSVSYGKLPGGIPAQAYPGQKISLSLTLTTPVHVCSASSR